MESTEHTKRPRRKVTIAIIVGVLLAAVGGTALVLSLAPGWNSDVTASPQTDSSIPATTPTPDNDPGAGSTQPADSPRALPTDCRAIYTQAFLDEYADVELNMPEVMDHGISRFAGVEAIREELPGLECYWGGPTEGGLQAAVNALPNSELNNAIAAVKSAGATCEMSNEGTLCRYSKVIEPSDDEPFRWTIAEQYFFRDGWWVTTWQASTGRSIDQDTQPMYDTLWP